MKMIVLVAVLAAAGCSKKSSSASTCADAIAKGVDQMIGRMQERLVAADAPPEVKASMAEKAKRLPEMAGKLKAVITNRCTEDKWSEEILSCYSTAGSVDEMRKCRSKLPAEQAQKLQADEMQVMMGAMGGMGGGRMGRGMGGPGMGGPGMGGPGMGGPGMGGPGAGGPGAGGSGAAGSAAPGSAAAGSAAPPAPAAPGSGAK